MTAYTPIESFDAKAFRDALGCFPTGVAVVTTRAPDGAPVGLTISSFNSVSMAPPLILWSLKLNAGSLGAFRANPGYVINVLAADQADLAKQFSRPVEDRFGGIGWRNGALGLPVLDGAAAVFECRSHARYPGGDHEIFIGEVVRHAASDRVPLVFGKGRLMPLPAEAQ